ncbi:YfiR family protein [Pantoea sp.]|uniref:YfiR family protein n=1 Tax=Pantoea sp. TaxID=69393 RepID=UPI0028AB38EF|nr:YfiR family protein [Pantoea sp.]
MSISQENPCTLNGKYACLLATSAARIWLITFSLLLLLVSSPLRAAEASDDAANRIVSGIISFTQWPGLKHPPQLCVLPSVSHLSLPQGREQGFSVVWLASEEALAEQPCDAVYFGAQSPQQQVALLEKASSRPMLSIAENNPECTIGASFCLIFHQDKTVFSVNLDSLTRSGVRVSPDVLLLSRKGSQ